MAKQAIDELAVIITANSSKLPTDLNKAKKEFDKFAKDVAAAHPPPVKPPDMRHVRQAHKDAASALSAVRQTGESVLGFMGKVAATGGTLLAVEAGISGVAGAFAELKDSVRMAAELEQTKLGFEVMLGSAQEAARLVADVRKYAAATPFNTRELTGATRQLVAYGRGADTAMQDLKMLGDVSAAFGDSLPINDLVYLYGTLYAQQRAFTKDLYQFAGRGIPIWDELAKVTGKTGGELRDMVEDGRIGFAEVEAAFKRMTAEGGRFHGMTARQGQTTAGIIEQMKDSFELFKTEVGQVLIDELGIKQGARDLEAFAGRLRENVGVLRPAVKLVGDLARGAAQVGYEFARAGIQVASLNLESYANALPGLQQISAAVRGLVEDAAGFKLNEKDVIDFSFAFGKAMSTNIASIGQQVGTFGEGMLGLFEWVVRSAREARDYMAQTAAWIKRINDGVAPAMKFLNPGFMIGDLIADVNRAQQDSLRGRRLGDPIRATEILPPQPGMHPDRVREEMGALTGERDRAATALGNARNRPQIGRFDLPTSHFERVLADAQRRLDEYVGGFEGDPADVRRHLASNNIPPIRDAAPRAGADADWAAQLQRGLQSVREVFAAMRGMNADRINTNLDQAHKRAIDQLNERTAAERAATEAIRQQAALRGALFGSAAVLEKPVDQAADRRAAMFAGVGGPAGLARTDDLRIAPDIQALIGDIRKQYDPRRELDAYRAQLDQIQSRGLMGPDTNAFVDRAWRDKVGDVAGRMGVGQQRYQLPEATEVGTREDARIVTAWQTAGRADMSVPNLLQQILQAINVQNGQFASQAFEMASSIASKIPRPVSLFGE